MANTTDMIITCFEPEAIIKQFGVTVGLDFHKITDENASGGDRPVCFSSYAASYRTLDQNKIQEVIRAFKEAPFTSPELAALIIDDDQGTFSGLVSPISGIVTGDLDVIGTQKPTHYSLKDLVLDDLDQVVDDSEHENATSQRQDR